MNRNEYDYSGENTEIELNAIKKFFGENAKIEKINDKERQIKGIDYIVEIESHRIKVDTKIHYFKSDILVYEFDDKREKYKGHAWGDPNAQKETDILIWIMPAYDKAVVFNYKKLIKHYDEFINDWTHADYMDTKYGTQNIWLPIDEIEKLKVMNINCETLKEMLHENFYKPSHKREYDELKELFEKRLKQMEHNIDIDDNDFNEFYVKPFVNSVHYMNLRKDPELFGEFIKFDVIMRHKKLA